MNKPNDMNDNDNDVRPYVASEEDRDAQREFEAAGQTNNGITNNAQSPVQTDPSRIRKPTARILAKSFNAFRPSMFLREYRTAKAARLENFRTRQQYTYSEVGQDEQSDGQPGVGVKGRVTNALSRLLPIAAVIGNWPIPFDMEILPLLGIVLIAVLCVCLGGFAILNIVGR